MTIHVKCRSIKMVAAALVITISLLGPVTAVGSRLAVRHVVDGDTVVMSDSSRVRLVGIDAPEVGEPWRKEATRWLERESLGREVQLTRCDQRDKFGRILGVLVRGGNNLNLQLLEEGLAVPLLIPPCGKLLLPEALKAAAGALLEGRGLYSQPRYKIVQEARAGELVGHYGVVRGRILSLHRGTKAIHLNFGPDWRTDFTAVIFSGGRERFEALGMDLAELVGRDVLVMGPIREYNGPEIVVRYPEQILPLPEPPGGNGADGH